MNTMIKRGTFLTLALLMLAMSFIVPFRSTNAATTYNNTTRTSLCCNVASNGSLYAELGVTGIKGKTSRIEVELYVEKRVLGIFWSRVNIGYEDNVWRDSINGYIYDNTFSTPLSSTGTYRVTATFTVSGSGGSNDVITMTDTVTY